MVAAGEDVRGWHRDFWADNFCGLENLCNFAPTTIGRRGYSRRTAAQRTKTNRGFAVFARFFFVVNPSVHFLREEKNGKKWKSRL
jgi:hypothetical protein